MSNFVNFSLFDFVYCFNTISRASSLAIRSINSLIVPFLSLYYFRLLWARSLPVRVRTQTGILLLHIIHYYVLNEIRFTSYQGVCNTPLRLFIFILRDTQYYMLDTVFTNLYKLNNPA